MSLIGKRRKALQWIGEARERDQLQEELPLIDFAKESVELIHKIIPIKAYISTRPIAVKTGTEKWLEKHTFPKSPSSLDH